MASSTLRKTNPVTPEIEVLIAEARDPKTPFKRLNELVEHTEKEVRRAALDNPNICPTRECGGHNTYLLVDLAREFPEEMAAHPLFLLYGLIEPIDEMKEVIEEVVERTKDVGLIERVLSTWGKDLWTTRQSVASNANTPERILRMLGNETTESDWEVRQAVAKNLSTPGDVLRILGNPKTESDGRVRNSVANNPSTPGDVLKILANKLTESRSWTRRAVASNPSAPEDLLRILGDQQTESDVDVREAVASNPSAPIDVLRTLGNEKTEHNWWVRVMVAKNPNTPVEVLRLLGNQATESYEISREAAQKALAERGFA